MKLSVILISYDMAREIPRTLMGLSRTYQHGAQALEYEVILVDNGSPVLLDPASWSGVDVPVRFIPLENAPPSPAQAINLALKEATGDILCLMIDGAHILTPGVFRMALACYEAFENPVVATRYFWMGPEEQNESIVNGYDKQVEDALLKKIDWPENGYRLYEIGTPLRTGDDKIGWMNRMFESNCLFMRRSLFEEQGGADERFDLPGGGYINLDIFNRAIDAPGVTATQLIGEGCFHQLHGGTTTNVSARERDARLEKYRQQFAEIRGHGDVITKKKFYYFGHMPTNASKIHRRNK
jgi:glycosyltransferase involved in cell wall biosynthesis|tara:strand:+ start:16329 stop:17219 length:891 start_codon:yes stop_codon:yes gene_type:complete